MVLLLLLLLLLAVVRSYDLSYLKSGSDIRGTFSSASSADNSSSGQNLTPRISYSIGAALARTLPPSSSLLLGRDPRLSGPSLLNSFSLGLTTTQGLTTKTTNIATTPSIFQACLTGYADYGCIVTASHLPSDKNGFKIFDKHGPVSVERRDELLKVAGRIYDEIEGEEYENEGRGEGVDYMEVYVASLVDYVESSLGPKGLSGLKVLLNSGSGSGFYLNEVLGRCGADVSCSINLKPDGRFQNGPPNPEAKRMVTETIKACEKSSEVDLGIMLDTDGDRVGFITPGENGRFVPLNRNRFVAVMASILANNNEGGKEIVVVTDSVTSLGLEKFVNGLKNMRMVRFKKGYMNVINEAKRLCGEGVDAELAIETSGHSAFRGNSFMDDGTYSAIVVVCELARRRREAGGKGGSVMDWIEGLEEASFEEELRLQVLQPKETPTINIYERIEEAVKNDGRWKVDELNREGVRLVLEGEWGEGWFMLRPSLHDPVVSMQVECEVEKSKRLVGEVRNLIFAAVQDAVDFGELDGVE
ncbi:hypothetical protein TrST_g10057 [Triparma strigata]|uniref:Uncharacterized protein n=1 Tax=Triparma strigata TaxID=1606541 RepID=A0A9W7AQJ9_9STRA|nr:hypothetical protein TrST_g10057 [Triparma strigata]